MQYDVLIIGSGMGGLVCGDVLSREGYRVCILEKNRQLGGSLQIFTRNRVVFDSGVHYLGGLAPGQNLYQIFRYLGLMDKLKLERMDPAFDRILVGYDPKEYFLYQGYDAFTKSLIDDFPAEETAIRDYVEKMQFVCGKFPMYALRVDGSATEKQEVWDISAREYIESLTNNETLRAVLAGNNMLYAGSGERTPFYVHALILNSYIESAWRCVDGGGQIAKIMAGNIRARGGTILNNKKVARIIVKDDRIESVELTTGEQITAARFISNMSPANTFRLTDSPLIRPMTRQRLAKLPPTVSSFIVNLVFRKNSVPYRKHNFYWHRQGRLWDMDDYSAGEWPLGYALYMSPSGLTGEFADGMTIFAYMRYEEVKPWEETVNTVSHQQARGDGYDQFKKDRAEQLLDCVEQRFPDIRKQVTHYYTSTPLTYRDYIGSDDGNLYGAAKDYRDPYGSMVEARTKIGNLFLTGQDLNLHGILGASISGLVTCAAVMGSTAFIEKIKNG